MSHRAVAGYMTLRDTCFQVVVPKLWLKTAEVLYEEVSPFDRWARQKVSTFLTRYLYKCNNFILHILPSIDNKKLTTQQ
jgi:hypothetical protein